MTTTKMLFVTVLINLLQQNKPPSRSYKMCSLCTVLIQPCYHRPSVHEPFRSFACMSCGDSCLVHLPDGTVARGGGCLGAEEVRGREGGGGRGEEEEEG